MDAKLIFKNIRNTYLKIYINNFDIKSGAGNKAYKQFIQTYRREPNDDLDLIIIESGGDNVTTTFSPALADYTIYIVDVSGGDKYPRKGGLGIETSDLLVINKIDLAPTIGADLNVMERDAKIVRKNKPYVLVICKTDQGVEDVAQHIIHDVLFDEPPKNMLTQVKS